MTGIDSPRCDGDDGDDRRASVTEPTCVTGAARPKAVCAGIGACALVAAAFAVLAVAALAAGSVVAGDNVAIFRPEPADLEAEPGDEFAVDVVMTSHGGYDDVGVVSVDFAARYHPDYLEVIDVEAGPWLEQGNETDVRRSSTVANDDGVALLEQRRDPPAGGATGEAVLATVTFRVPDDADPARATVDFSASEVVLESQIRQPTHDRYGGVTVTIAGGEERHEEYDHPAIEDVRGGSEGDEGSDSSADGGTGSSEGSGDDGRDSSGDGASENDADAGSGGDGAGGGAPADSSDETAVGDGSGGGADDPTAGFTAGVAALAVTLVVALAVRRARG